EMKRSSALALSLLVVFACFAPSLASAKLRHYAPTKAPRAAPAAKAEATEPPPLPDPNPNRVASSDTSTPQAAAPEPQTFTVNSVPVTADATATTGSVGLTANNGSASGPSVPDRNPNAPGSDQLAAATPTVSPKSDPGARLSIVPLPDRNP